MPETTYVDFEITKSEFQPDGSVFVWGPATSDDLDSDKQIIDAEFAAKKLPEWLKSGGNVREMHQPKAVGVGIELERVGNQHWLKSRVVHSETVNLVRNKVLRAYSVGISNAKVVRDARAPGGRIVDGDFVEVSLVDRPANATCKVDLVEKLESGDARWTDILVKDGDCPTCHGTGKIREGNMTCPKCHGSGSKDDWDDSDSEKFALFTIENAVYKKDYSTEDRKRLASEGKALPDGSYPIDDAEDLKNAAILARSGHGDTAGAKRLIGRRAKELGVANPLDSEKGQIPPDDQKVTDALDKADDDLDDAKDAQQADNAAHMSGGDEDDDDNDQNDDGIPAKEASYQVRRLHDYLCAAYSAESLKDAYPTVRNFGDVVDPRYFAERVTELVDATANNGAFANELAKASELYGVVIDLVKSQDAYDMAHDALHGLFKAEHPSVSIGPGNVAPGMFKRPYISSGHANQNAKPGQKPRLPMQANVPNPDDFERPFLGGAGHSAQSPMAGPPNSSSTKIDKSECTGQEIEVNGIKVFKISHEETGIVGQGLNEEAAWEDFERELKARDFYTHASRDRMLGQIAQAHDILAAAHPQCCPMSTEKYDESNDPTLEQAMGDGAVSPEKLPNGDHGAPHSVPGYTKIVTAEGTDITKIVHDEIEKAIQPLTKKVKKQKKTITKLKAENEELARRADPDAIPFRGNRGALQLLPKRNETTESAEDPAEVEKREYVGQLVKRLHEARDVATQSQAMEKLQAILTPDQLAAALTTKTG